MKIHWYLDVPPTPAGDGSAISIGPLSPEFLQRPSNRLRVAISCKAEGARVSMGRKTQNLLVDAVIVPKIVFQKPGDEKLLDRCLKDIQFVHGNGIPIIIDYTDHWLSDGSTTTHWSNPTFVALDNYGARLTKEFYTNLMDMSSAIIAPTVELEMQLTHITSKRVFVVPDSIDVIEVAPHPNLKDGPPTRALYYGMPKGFPILMENLKLLDAMLHVPLRLEILTNSQVVSHIRAGNLVLGKYSKLNITLRPWEREKVSDIATSCDFIFLPAPLSESHPKSWASENRLIQGFQYQRPILAGDYHSYRRFSDHYIKWPSEEAANFLATGLTKFRDPRLLGQARSISEEYSADRLAKTWTQVLGQIING